MTYSPQIFLEFSSEVVPRSGTQTFTNKPHLCPVAPGGPAVSADSVPLLEAQCFSEAD